VIAAQLSIVVADMGKPRHDAGYLAAFVMQVSDPASYVAALTDLNKAIGNPGVLRLVSLRSGSTEATHAVLVGGNDFAAVNEYLDKLFASDAYRTFNGKVGDIRTMRSVNMYRRVSAWGY
jgi:hypothetical protein